jgi:hypothetical protein
MPLSLPSGLSRGSGLSQGGGLSQGFGVWGGSGSPVSAWVAAVAANGGTVSVARQALINAFVTSEINAGNWANTDDYWMLAAENSTQALTSLKQRRLAVATAAPTFTANQGYTGNGTSQFIDTKFVCSTNGVAMTGSNLRLAIYERGNVSTLNAWAAGVSQSTTQNLQIDPRSALNQIAANCTILNGTVGDSLALTVINRSGSTFTQYKRGVSSNPGSPGASGTVLPTVSLYILAVNSSGSAAGFRAAQEAFICVGGSLTSTQELAQYNNVQTWLTAIGANV